MLTPKWRKNLSGWLCLLAWFFSQTHSFSSQQRPVVETFYDDAGRVVKVIDPLGNETETVYDRAGRACVVIAPQTGEQTHITRTVYDGGGNAMAVKDAKGQTVTNTYDDFSRLIKTVDEATIENEFGYDKDGNRTLVKDGEGKVSTFAYDALKRLRSQTFPNGDTWSYDYERMNKVWRVDAKGQVTIYKYDVHNRLRWSQAPGLERTLSYDKAGRLLKVEEEDRPEAEVEYTYDLLGRQLSEKARGVTHVYGYDLGGNRVKAAYGTERTVTTVYDGLSRPETITEGGRTTRYGYDLAGRAVFQVSGNGQVAVNGYDELGRLKERTLYQSTATVTEGGVLARFTWGHDAVGNVEYQQETWAAHGEESGRGRETEMSYDGANRLVTEVVTDSVGGMETGTTTTAYDYDKANNRLTKTVTGVGETGHWEYEYNVANQLTNWEKRTSAEGTLVKEAALGYDANGNRNAQWVRTAVEEEADPAQVSNQGIVYEAAQPGQEGHGLTVRLKEGAPGASLSVKVAGAEDLQNLAGLRAASAVNQGITYRARERGVAGDGIEVKLLEGSVGGALGIAVDEAEREVEVTLPYTLGDKAQGSVSGMTFTATQAGSAGNAIQVAISSGTIGGEIFADMLGSNVVVIHPVCDEMGTVLNTTAEMMAAVNLYVPGKVAVTGGDSRTAPRDVSFYLTGGGANSVLATTRTALVAALGAHAEASELVDASGSGTEKVTPGATLTLSGGADAQVGEMPVNVEVTLAKSAGVKGTLVDQGLTYHEKTPGNGASVELVAPTEAEQELVVSAAGNVVTVNLASGPEMNEPATGEAWPYEFTAVEPGEGGNAITVEIVDPGEPNYGGGVAVDGHEIVITLETDGTGYSATTAGMIGTWLANSLAVASLVTWDSLTTNPADPVFASGVVTHLSGGFSGYETTTTANDLAALGTLAGLVEVTGSGTTPLQGRAETALSGGVAPVLISTVEDVVDLLTEDAEVGELLTASGAGNTVLAAAGPLKLVSVQGGAGTGQLTLYEWDAQDRLVGVRRSGGVEYDYTYDYRTRRIGIGQGGTAEPEHTAVLFGGGLSLAEYVSPTEQTTISSPETSTVEYMRGPDMGGGVGGMLYSIRGSDWRYNLSNGRGDVVAQSDPYGMLQWTASYEAGGKRTKETGSNADKQRANSKDEDPTGLLNEGFRYRDIETGMFISRDPAGFVDGPNVYAYVRQNPWTGWDPHGLAELTEKIRSAIYTEAQHAADMAELFHGPTGDNLSIANAKHRTFGEIMKTSQYSEFVVSEQSINPKGGAVNMQKNPQRYPAGSVRPDLIVLTDSAHKATILNGGGVDLHGKIDSIIDLKTGAASMQPDWISKVSERTGVRPSLIKEARPFKNLREDFKGSRNRSMAIVALLGMATDIHHATVDEMDRLNDQNPYVGQTAGGLRYVLTFQRKNFTFLPISVKLNHAIRVINGPFEGSEMSVSEERWNQLNDELAKKHKP